MNNLEGAVGELGQPGRWTQPVTDSQAPEGPGQQSGGLYGARAPSLGIKTRGHWQDGPLQAPLQSPSVLEQKKPEADSSQEAGSIN